MFGWPCVIRDLVRPGGAAIKSRDRPGSLSSTQRANASHLPVTRSHKYNERDHQGLRDGTASEEQHLPRYFAKHGHVDADPKKVKKDGSGKANWGQAGDEVIDGGYNMHQPRRRSNSSVGLASEFKTKFETVDPEPVFEEELHGDGGVDAYSEQRDTTAAGESLSRYDTSSKSSASDESVDEGLRKL